MLMGKKGQAALEYLMTYSWALVAIAIVIGVLIFMGILKAPSAGTCTGLEKLAYEDHTIDSNGNFILYLKNGAGMQISISGALPGEDFGGSCSASSPIINATRDFNIVCTNTGISAGQAYKGKITIEYMRRSAKHTESAACSGTAPLTGIFLLASAPQIVEGFFAGGSSNLDLNNPDEMMLEMGGGSYASFGSYTSNILDANSTMDWSASISWDENAPIGTDINLQTRTSDNNSLWSAWSGYYTNASGQAITSPNGRFIQYKANLSTTNPALTPRLLEVRMHGNPLAQSCGNLKREGTEQCDTNDLAGSNCILLGYSSGALACTGACAFDTNGCAGATTTMLCPGSKTWTSQSDWQSGALANIDATSSPGSIKLSLPSISGTWNIVVDSNAAPTDWNAISWGEDLNYGGELSADANTRLLLHLNEGSGATASDASGNGNNGTISGATWTASGKFGNALQFDGVNDQVNITSSPSIEFGDQSFTFMAWFKTTASGQNVIISNYHVDAEYIALRTDYQGSNRLEGTSRDSADVSIVLRSPNAVNDGNWHFAAYVRDTAANIVRLYLDGVDVNSSADIRTGDFIDEVGNNAYEIGSINDGAFFNGTIDEVAIYNRALGASEILEHYKRGALNLRLRTRSAASQGALGSASWSQYYTGTPSAILSPDNKWIEVQALLETENSSYTPMLNDASISCAGAQGNLAPFAGLGASAYSADVGTYITVYGNTSYDLDGNIVNYAWNFGDGNVVASGASIMYHAYGFAGDYNATLTVTDNNGATDANTVSINITSGPISFCPGTKVWTSQSDWQGGNDANVDSNFSPGNLLLAKKGELAADANTRLLLHLNEGSGATASDASGNGNNGTISGATWTASGKFGNALQFDGNNDYVWAADNSSLDLTNNFTLEAWVYPYQLAGGAGGRDIIAKVGGIGGNNGYEFGMANDGTLFCQFNATGEPWPTNSVDGGLNTIQLNQWTHVACTYDNNMLRLYKNSTLIGSSYVGAKSAANSSSKFRIGGNDNDAVLFNGKIDEAAVYGRALTAQEIFWDYAGYNLAGTLNELFDSNSIASDWDIINWGEDLNYGSELAADANTKALWHLNEVSGSTANDSSGNGNNGTLFNGPVWTSSGRFGNALQFDGTDDYVKFSAANMPTAERTVELWFYTSDTSANRQLFGYGGNSNIPAYSSFLIYFSSADKRNITVHRHYSGGDVLNYTSPSPLTNAWHYLAFTTNSGGSKLYIDGQLVISNSTTILTYVAGKDGFVGAEPGGSGVGTYVDPNYPYWKGNIDEVAVYNVALDANKILENYKRGAANIRARTRTAASQLALSSAQWSNENELDANADINGLWHFNEGSGATANDSSGNGNNGTLTNGPTWVSSGKFGNALQFDGVNDYVNIIKSDEFHFGASSFAVAAWVNFSALSGVQNILAFYVVTNNALQFAWNTDHFTVWGETSTVLDTTGFSPALDTWYHVAFVRNGNAWNIYVNGTSYANATDTRTLNYPKDNVGIGLLPTSLQYFNGKIDEVAIYNRALSASEVLELYRRGQYYTSSHSTITSDANRFIEVQALLETENASYTPVLNDLNISCS